MEKDFKAVVKEKTKDELIRIVINREEYKNELVDAAANELKLRDKESHSVTPDHTASTIQIPNEKDTPFGIYLAGILLFATGQVWLIIGFLQAGASAITADTNTGIISC